MGFEPMTLCDLARRSNHWATGESMVSKGEMKVFDWNCIAICMVRQPNDELADMNSLTASCSQIKAYQRCKQPPSWCHFHNSNSLMILKQTKLFLSFHTDSDMNPRVCSLLLSYSVQFYSYFWIILLKYVKPNCRNCNKVFVVECKPRAEHDLWHDITM